MRIITFGTFDLFHVGHLRILKRAKELGTHLTVGVSSDALNVKKKSRNPIIPQDQRMEIIKNIECVDEVFLEESLELKRKYINEHQADILVMGDDWKGRFDDMGENCRVVYLSRTNDVSTTDILENIICVSKNKKKLPYYK